jgi:hypothetical protein
MHRGMRACGRGVRSIRTERNEAHARASNIYIYIYIYVYISGEGIHNVCILVYEYRYTYTYIYIISGEGIEFVELENGCACCNASDELLTCILQVHITLHYTHY